MAAVSQGGTQALAAFEELYQRHEGPLFRFLSRMLGDRERAADAFQDTFQAVLENRHTYRHGARFSAWLYAIARNHAIDRLRKRELRPLSALDHSGQDDRTVDTVAARTRTPGEYPHQEVESREMQVDIRRALKALPDTQREIVLLRFFNGFTFAEISEILDTPDSTVRSRFHVGIESLRGQLDRWGQ